MVLAVIVAPLWIIVAIDAQQAESRDALYDLCMGFARDGPLDEYATAIHQCWEDRATDPYRPSWKEWREFLFGTLVACGIIYGLIWLIVLTVKWVWRGREKPN